MVSVQEFWIILGLTALIALLLGAGAAYFLLPKPQPEQETVSKPKKPKKSDDRIRRLFALITDLTVTLNYSRVLEKSLDVSFLALRVSNMDTDRLISAILLFTSDDVAVPDPGSRLRTGAAPARYDYESTRYRRFIGTDHRNWRPTSDR